MRITPVIVAALATVLAGPTAAPADPSGAAASRYGLAKGFQVVGYTSLAKRGVNSPIAVAGRCVYVGDRYDRNGIAVVDVAKPNKPRQVGVIPPVRSASQREIRADAGLGILVVMSYSTSGIGATSGNNLKVYDIRNCTKPALLSTVDFGARSPHEFFLWKDAKNPGRALAYVTFTITVPDLAVYDLTNPATPTLAAVYDTTVDGVVKPLDATNSDGGYLHSISVSDDGTRAYLGTWDYGLYIADTSSLAQRSPGVVVPMGAPLQYAGNVHGAVKVPGRDLAVMVEEGYASVVSDVTGAGGCPFGWMRMADISNPALPAVLGEFKIPENDCDRSKALNGTFTSHNQTVFPNVALLPWYGGGLRAVDISDPKNLRETGAFVPKPTYEPDRRDNRLYFNSDSRWIGAMWSYPVVQNGLIYVVDIDLGLYVLRYTGKHRKEVDAGAYVEGNSAPSRYSKKDPVIRRSSPLPLAPPRVLRDRLYLDRVPAGAKAYGFLCVGAA